MQARGELHLAPKPFAVHTRSQLRRQHLDDDLPAQRDIRRQKHATHPAAAEFAHDTVLVAQREFEVFLKGCGHGEDWSARG